MMSEKTKLWVKAAGIRAVKTMAQGALGVMAGATMFSQIDINVVISTALFAGLASVLTSLKGLPEVKLKGLLEVKNNERY